MTSTDRASLVCLLAQVGAAFGVCSGAAPPDLVLDIARARDRIARHPIPWAVTLHIGHIDHRHGANVYAAADRSGLIGQLAAFCRLWWADIDDRRDPETLDDEIAVQAYFERNGEEYLMVDTIELAGPAPATSTLEVELTLVLNTGHIMASTSRLLDEWAGLEPGNQPIGVADTGFGWFMPSLRLGPEATSLLPPDLAAVIAFARARGCRFLLLDRDGPEVDGLDCHA